MTTIAAQGGFFRQSAHPACHRTSESTAFGCDPVPFEQCERCDKRRSFALA